MTKIASSSPSEGSRSSSPGGPRRAERPRPATIGGQGRHEEPDPARTARADRGHQEIRSYLVRRGRTGPTSREAHARLWPVHGFDPPYDERLAFTAPLVLEIGFGMGEATATMAAADPGTGLLAVDVHPAGVMALLRRVERADLSNVRVVEGNAVEVLRGLPARSLAEVRLFFPDPWPKARHHKRRLVRPTFAALVASRLAPGGLLHVATDWPAYADHVREVLAEWDVVADRRSRPVTGYERRALAAGRQAVDLVATPPR